MAEKRPPELEAKLTRIKELMHHGERNIKLPPAESVKPIKATKQSTIENAQQAMAQVRKRQAQTGAGKPTVPTGKDIRPESMERMIDSIEAMQDTVTIPVNKDGMWQLINICRNCDRLQADGCHACGSCQDRWDAWQKRLIRGDCPRFVNPTASVDNKEPQFKVNEMNVFSYSVTYTTPDNDRRLALGGIVATDLASAMAAVKKVLPDATVIDARATHPINVIADNVIPSEIEVAKVEPRQQGQPMMGPGGQPMMMGPQGQPMMMAGPQGQPMG